MCILYFAKCLHGWLVDFVHYSLSLLDLDEFSEVPCELLRDVKVKVNVLHVDLTIIKDVGEQELVEDCCVTSDLFVDIRSVVELDSLVPFQVDLLLLVNVHDVDDL